MAFPTVRSSSSGSNINATNHTITLPATISADDLLLCIYVQNDADYDTMADTITWDDVSEGAWVNKVTGLNSNEEQHRYTIRTKIADGTEDSQTITPTTTNLEESAYVVYAIQDWKGDSADTDVLYAVDTAGGTQDTSPDPPNLAGLDDEDHLIIAACGWGINPLRTLTGFPSGFTANQLTVAQPTNYSNGMGAATDELTGTSVNPGSFTISGNSNWTSFTVSVRPVSTGTAKPLINGGSVNSGFVNSGLVI